MKNKGIKLISTGIVLRSINLGYDGLIAATLLKLRALYTQVSCLLEINL